MAIIGILAAIAIPQFTKYKRNAAKSACESDLKNCMSETSAQYALNSSRTNQTCAIAVPGNKFPGVVFSDQLGNLAVALSNATAMPALDSTIAVGVGFYNIPFTASINDNGANCTFED